jgi:hypothetical protein
LGGKGKGGKDWEVRVKGVRIGTQGLRGKSWEVRVKGVRIGR